ncbi:cation diffusion facilitator family transporter [Paenibacillus monticola]|uniref:Cation diffusion facilitator family transporter n=1 Tax=Paenibacillus monticola TaxID=2666075 RepID=A0A7X2H8H1_9BACL|nr:cation diffusion facilitator family transporter [Paenibacillus monticola]MRN55378.1 cation diffusion facilitator family transporter [Paenibacillus monticola]
MSNHQHTDSHNQTNHSQPHLHKDHDHHGHSHSGHSHAPNNKKGLLIALLITGGIMFLEFFGGLFTNSLALLSDSGHMLSDTASLALSLVAMIFAVKPPSLKNSYGFYRFEVMAALFNGVTLFVIAGFIMWEAYHRFFAPPTVNSGSMMIIASVGLLANLISAWMLMRKSDVKENLNIRSAYLHILSDALGSVGAIIAGLIMSLFSWYAADPIISVLVALLILKGAWGVIKQAFHILMEGTPSAVNTDQVKNTLMHIDGVINVHDLHIWTITSGLDSLSCHLLIKDDMDPQTILQQAVALMEEKFNIQHSTIQVENSQLQHGDLKV